MARQECDYYGGEIYSTNEQIVGTWIDGKPIYKCTFQPSSITDGTVLINSGVANIIKYESVMNWVSNQQLCEFAVVSGTNTFNGSAYPYLYNGQAQLYVRGTGVSNVLFVIITLWYTKTTD